MVGEPKSYHKNPETSYLEEGFSGIQNAAMVLISMDQIMKFGGFQKCKIHSSNSKDFKVTACQSWYIFVSAGICTQDPCRLGFLVYAGPGYESKPIRICTNFDKLLL